MSGRAGPSVAAALVALAYAGASAAHAQTGRAERYVVGPTLGYGIAAVAQTRFLSDGNGIAVTGRPALAGEIGLSWGRSDGSVEIPAWQVGAQLRGSFPTIRVTEPSGVGPDRDAGRAAILELALRVDGRLGGYRVHAAGGPVLLNGPDDVAPFRFGVADGPSLAGELGLARLIISDHVWATATGQVIRIDGAAADGRPVRGGAVGRLILGVRLAP